MKGISRRFGQYLKCLIAGMGLLACMLSASVFAAGPGIIVFGDSLSDPGNAFALLGATNTPPDYSVDPFLVPDRPYARGGQHFSNGPTWAEQFAKSQGFGVNANPAFRASNPGATNYAVGGARARENSGPVNLLQQVGAFLQDFGGKAPAGALYVIEAGSNDIRDAAYPPNPALLADAVAGVNKSISYLYGAGARQFLVWNAPKLSLSPAIQMAGATAAEGVELLTIGYNTQLEAALAELDSLDGIKIFRFDAYHTSESLHDNAQQFGLSDVTNPCITPQIAPFFCQTPDIYMFWDGIHPTKVVHAIFAAEVAKALAH